MKNIEQFSIKNLHGYMNFELIFADNTLILVGENGTGKTTVLRMLYYLLSGQWSMLKNYKFDSITLSIDQKIDKPRASLPACLHLSQVSYPNKSTSRLSKKN